MKPEILEACRIGARQIADETESRQDALEYAEELASEVNQDLRLGYEEGSDSHGCLFKACYDAIWEATR
jgi:hypothetical protein